jgi:AcrR family transcriptional regulator
VKDTTTTGGEPAAVAAERTAESAPPVDMEQRLLDVSLPLFARRGYGDVSMREVAAAAGVTTPTVYYYFGSKRGLYLRLVTDIIERRGAAMRAALAGRGDAIARLKRLLQAYALLDERGSFPTDAHLLLQRESFALGGDTIADLVNEHDASNRRLMRAVLHEGIEAGLFRPVRVEHTAIAIIGVMVSFIRRGARTTKLRPEDGIAQVLDVVLDGLRPRAADSAAPSRSGGRRAADHAAG